MQGLFFNPPLRFKPFKKAFLISTGDEEMGSDGSVRDGKPDNGSLSLVSQAPNEEPSGSW
jgi:hypothetical protein